MGQELHQFLLAEAEDLKILQRKDADHTHFIIRDSSKECGCSPIDVIGCEICESRRTTYDEVFEIHEIPAKIELVLKSFQKDPLKPDDIIEM